MALGAVVNALWDLWAKVQGKPVWKLVADMTPEEVVRCIDFRHITDATTPDEAVQLLREKQAGKAERVREVNRNRAASAYTTSTARLGYSKEKMQLLLKQNLWEGFKHFKLKVGGLIEEDRERLRLAPCCGAKSPPWVGVATGEMIQNRAVVKQLLQVRAIYVLRPDACRVGGVNEVPGILLLATSLVFLLSLIPGVSV